MIAWTPDAFAVAEGLRPDGQPGTIRGAFEYPAVQQPDGTVLHWRCTILRAPGWVVTPARLAATFTPGPEWQASCTHSHGVPWVTCASRSQCWSLTKEEAR